MSLATTTDDLVRADALREELARRYDVRPECVRVARAPYRVCPLGAHIDHQLGVVTAFAIDQSVLLAYAPSGSCNVRLSSLDFPGAVEFSLDDIPLKQAGDWGAYPRGAAQALQNRCGLKQGIVGVTSGKLHGGGVSSSAAVGVAFLLAFEEANGLDVTPAENVLLDQEIENRYLGLQNGILDQAAILLSRRGHLTRIDCAANRYEQIPPAPNLPPFKILLAFSGLKRALVGTDYNRRVEECAQAARVLLAAAGRDISSRALGAVTPEEYAAHRGWLQGAPARRAAHFFGETARVREGIAAWENGDLAVFGALMTASGESSILNYECGSPPLINLYHLLIKTPGVLGARFSGAGFRGCCAALVAPEGAAAVAEEVHSRYAGLHPELAEQASFVVTETAEGAAILDETLRA